MNCDHEHISFEREGLELFFPELHRLAARSVNTILRVRRADYLLVAQSLCGPRQSRCLPFLSQCVQRPLLGPVDPSKLVVRFIRPGVDLSRHFELVGRLIELVQATESSKYHSDSSSLAFP